MDNLDECLTKRETIAAMAMQALIQRVHFASTKEGEHELAETIGGWATVYADALLKELSK